MRLIQDDAHFRQILRSGSGYVYNDYSGRGVTGNKYNILHHVSCGSIRQAGARVTESYKKYFADSLEGAVAWLRANRGSSWKFCGTCLREPRVDELDSTATERSRSAFVSMSHTPMKDREVSKGSPGVFDIDTAKQLVETYNRNSFFVSTDFEIGQAFDMPATLEAIRLRVDLIERLWSAGLWRNGAEPGHVARRLFDNDPVLVSGASHLSELNLFDLDLRRPVHVDGLLIALEQMMEICGFKAISFCSKYLHWAYPSLFAPYDARAHHAANVLLASTVGIEEPWKRRYQHVLGAHQALWKGLSEDDQLELLRFDYETQPPEFRRRLHPLRVLDKVLWMAGKQNA